MSAFVNADGSLITDVIHNGKAEEVLLNLPDNSIDCAMADPPFNVQFTYGAGHKDNMTPEQYLKWSELWLREVVRVTKPTGSIFVMNIPRWLGYYQVMMNRMGPSFRNWIVWDVHCGMVPPQPQMLLKHQGILYYHKVKGQAKEYGLRVPHETCAACGAKATAAGDEPNHPFGMFYNEVWSDIPRWSGNSDHPCQLPVPLIERVILMTTDPGDVVLDPFMGGGTTAAAAKQLGRRYVGSELNPENVKAANRWLENVTESKLGQFYVSRDKHGVRSIRDIDWKALQG